MKTKLITKMVFGAVAITAMVIAGEVMAATPKGFTDDFDAAVKEAEKSKKNLLVVFTGSDWCPWCVKLEEGYLSKSEFVTAAAKKFELVYLDFPRDKSLVSEKNAKRNDELKQKYGIRGFPTVKIINVKGEDIGEARPDNNATPEAYVEQLITAAENGPLVKKYIKPYKDELNDLQTKMQKKMVALGNPNTKDDKAMKENFEKAKMITAEFNAGITNIIAKLEAEKMPDELIKEKEEFKSQLTMIKAFCQKMETMTYEEVKAQQTLAEKMKAKKDKKSAKKNKKATKKNADKKVEKSDESEKAVSDKK